MRQRLGLTVSCLVACGAPPAGVSPPTTPPPPEPPATIASPPVPAPIAKPTPEAYPPDEAIRDALSGPLTLVGVGGWPGTYRRLACIYRNERVFVVDERCSDPREPTGIAVHVLSPTRGGSTVTAEGNAPISSLKRAAYSLFAVGTQLPWPPPKVLDLQMSYEQVFAYKDHHAGTVPATCVAGTIYKQQPHCSKTMSVTPAAYAQLTTAFVAEPGDGWYELVGKLVGLRKEAHASIRPASLPVERLRAWGASWGRDHDVTVRDHQLKHVGNTEGIFAAIMPTADGGAVIAGVGTSSNPAVARVDANGKKLWVKQLSKQGFVVHEEATVVATADAVYVHSPGHVKAGSKPMHRVIKLDHKGNVKWEWVGRGKGLAIPQPTRARITPQGTVVLTGFIQLVSNGEILAWSGEVDGKGKTLRDEVGAVLPDGGASIRD